MTRQWWIDWLGAVRDPSGGFVVGEPAAYPFGGTRRRVDLTSYGSTLVAELVLPDGPSPHAAVVVPFYETTSVLGEPTTRLYGRSDAQRWSYAYARHLVTRGVAVLAVPWWFEQEADVTAPLESLPERYDRAATMHDERWRMTGLGRSVADLMLAVDVLVEMRWIDQERIGAFGHSLGGKLALHLAALDERVVATVAHEPGVGLAHSNWSDPWYLGAHVPTDRDHDDLVRLIAPREALIVGGGDSDGAHNHDLLVRARSAWGDDGGLHTLYHDHGHHHPDHVLAACYAWLVERLERKPFPWPI